MGTVIWYPNSRRRVTRRQLIVDASRLGVATVVVGTFADFVAACGGSSSAPTTQATTASSSSSGSSAGSTAAATGAGTKAAAATSAGSPAAAAPASMANAVRGGSLRYGTLGDATYGSLDMTTTTGTYDLEISLGMQDAYVYLLPDSTFAPGLADSWDISPDGLTYTFKLRQDVMFHDGTPLDAKAVKYNFDRMTDRKTNPSGLSYSYLGAGVSYDGCEVVDQYTVRHHLKVPNAIFMYRMRRAYMSPQSPAAIEKYGQDYFRNPVSVGPFKFVEWVQGDHVTLAANPDYKWGPKTIFGDTNRPFLDQLTQRIFKDLTTKATALESGEIDHAARLNPEDVSRFKDNSKLKVVVRDQMGQSVQINLNVEKPPTDDLAVRQAIGWAIDRNALVKSVFFGLFDPATHLFTPNMWSYDASLNSLFGYDTKKAEQILDQAGWTRSGNGTRAKNGQELRLVMLGSQEGQPVAQFLQSQLQKIGMAVDIQTLAGAGLNEATLKGQHNMYWEGHWIQEDPDVLRNWIQSSLIDVRQDYVRVRDPNLDNLLNQGIAFVGDAHSPERAKIYQQAQKTIMENAYIIPLYYEKSLEAYHVNVHPDNIGYDPYGTYHYWNNVWMDKK